MGKKFAWKKLDRIVGAIAVVGLVVYFVGKSVFSPDCEEVQEQIVAEIANEQEATEARTDINVYQRMQINGRLRASLYERLEEAGCKDWATEKIINSR